jgi:hypothetical protein
VEKVATPEAFSVPVPSVVVPFLKVTVPVGVPVPDWRVTVAVKVTFWHQTEGLSEEVRAVDVLALPTVWVRTALVLPARLGLPPYTAVMEWAPRERVDVAKVATPPVSGAVPSVVLPSLNVTVPVGVPAALFTVAVKVTFWQKADGLGEEVSVVVVATLLTT